MTLTLTPAAILLLLKTFAVPPIDAHEVNREVRLGTIAVAVWDAARHATCKGPFAVPECKPIARDEFQVAAELAGLAGFETDLRSNVHRDECKPYECDPSKLRIKGKVLITHRARSLWQLQRASSWSAEKWESFSGDSLESTSSAAWQAARMMAGYRGMYKTGTKGVFDGMATGGRGTHKDSERRARMVEKYRAMLVGFAQKGDGQ